MASSEIPVLNEDIREELRKRGEPIEQTVSLQEREDGTWRVTIMKAASEAVDGTPDTLTEYYDPDLHAVVLPLPQRAVANDNHSLDEF